MLCGKLTHACMEAQPLESSVGTIAVRRVECRLYIGALILYDSLFAGGRLVMHIPFLTAAQAAIKGVKAQESKAEMIQGRITAITPTHMDVTLDSGAKGRVCLCEVQLPLEAATEGARGLEGYTVGQNIEAFCYGPCEGFEGRKQGLQDLSLRPAVIAAGEKKEKTGHFRLRARQLKPGQKVYG